MHSRLKQIIFSNFLLKDQRDLFRLVWFKDNVIKRGENQVFRFSRHVWGINSSLYNALYAVQRLMNENSTNASRLTLEIIENNSYMDDLLITADRESVTV